MRNWRLFLLCVGFLLSSLGAAHAQCTRNCGIDTPTASLTANGRHNITVGVGSTITYDWSSAYAEFAASSFTVDGGGPSGWEANSLHGGVSGTAVTSQVGHTYVITYTVTNSARQRASDQVTIRVIDSLTASLTANGLHDITVGVGSKITYDWSSAYAEFAASSFAIDGGGSSGWEANSLSGGVSGTVVASQVGHTYVIIYTVTNPVQQTASDQVTIRVVDSTTASLVPNTMSFSCVARAVGGGCSAPQTAILTNTGASTLFMDEIRVSGEYFSQMNACSGSLEPGQFCRITVSFDGPASRSRPQEKTYAGSLFVYDTASPSSQTGSLTGTTSGVP